MSEKIIHSALRTQFASIPSYPKAYMNLSYTPTEGVLYLQEFFIPSEVFQVGIEDGSTNEYRGIYQISIQAPVSVDASIGGMSPTYQALEDIKAYFYRGLILNDTVRITKVYPSSSIVGDSWMLTPVTINYTAFIK